MLKLCSIFIVTFLCVICLCTANYCPRRKILNVKLKGRMYESAIWTLEDVKLACGLIDYPIEKELTDDTEKSAVLDTDNKKYVVELTCSSVKSRLYKDTVIAYTTERNPSKTVCRKILKTFKTNEFGFGNLHWCEDRQICIDKMTGRTGNTTATN